MKKSSQRTAVAALSITQRSQGHHSLVERRHVHGERCQVLLHVLLARVPDVRKVQWQRYLTFVYVFPHFFFFSALNVPSCLIRDAGDAPELLSPWELEPCLERSHTTRKNANRTALPARPTVNSLPSQGYSFELCLLLYKQGGVKCVFLSFFLLLQSPPKWCVRLGR